MSAPTAVEKLAGTDGPESQARVLAWMKARIVELPDPLHGTITLCTEAGREFGGVRKWMKGLAAEAKKAYEESEQMQREHAEWAAQQRAAASDADPPADAESPATPPDEAIQLLRQIAWRAIAPHGYGDRAAIVHQFCLTMQYGMLPDALVPAVDEAMQWAKEERARCLADWRAEKGKCPDDEQVSVEASADAWAKAERAYSGDRISEQKQIKTFPWTPAGQEPWPLVTCIGGGYNTAGPNGKKCYEVVSRSEFERRYPGVVPLTYGAKPIAPDGTQLNGGGFFRGYPGLIVTIGGAAGRAAPGGHVITHRYFIAAEPDKQGDGPAPAPTKGAPSFDVKKAEAWAADNLDRHRLENGAVDMPGLTAALREHFNRTTDPRAGDVARRAIEKDARAQKVAARERQKEAKVSEQKAAEQAALAELRRVLAAGDRVLVSHVGKKESGGEITDHLRISCANARAVQDLTGPVALVLGYAEKPGAKELPLPRSPHRWWSDAAREMVATLGEAIGVADLEFTRSL